MKRKNSGPWKYLVLLVIVMAGISLGYKLVSSDTVDCSSTSFYGYRLEVPSNASNVQESCRNGLNPTYQSSFTIAPNDLDALKQNTYIKDISTWQTTVPGDSAFQSQAAQASSLLYGIFSNGAVAAEVLIDTSKTDLYTLYVRLINID